MFTFKTVAPAESIHAGRPQPVTVGITPLIGDQVPGEAVPFHLRQWWRLNNDARESGEVHTNPPIDLDNPTQEQIDRWTPRIIGSRRWVEELGQHSLIGAYVLPDDQSPPLGDKDLIGNVICAWLDPDAPTLMNLYVEPAWRNRGIGRSLLAEAVRYIAPEQNVVADVRADKTALISGYMRAGWTNTGPVTERGSGTDVQIEAPHIGLAALGRELQDGYEVSYVPPPA